MDTEDVPVSAKKVGKVKGKTKFKSKPALDEGTKRQDGTASHGLWECYSDQTISAQEEGHDGALKNIRGFLLKKRKSPLKGWQKCYYVLEKGILIWGRSRTHLEKGKTMGRMDLGLTVITYDASSKRMDLDGDHQVLHLKTKSTPHFVAWSYCLTAQESYRKAQLAGADGISLNSHVLTVERDDFASWIKQGQDVCGTCKKDMDAVRENLEAMFIYVKYTNPRMSTSGMDGTWDPLGDQKKKKEKKKKEKKSLHPSELSTSSVTAANSNNDDQLIESSILLDDFGSTARIVYSSLTEIVDKLNTLCQDFTKANEKHELYAVQMEGALANQRVLLRQALVQNAELKDRLAQIQSLSAGFEAPSSTFAAPPRNRTPQQWAKTANVNRLGSFRSLQSSMSDKFFDALDELHDSTDTEEEGEEVTDSPGEEAEADWTYPIAQDLSSTMKAGLSSMSDVSKAGESPSKPGESPSKMEVSSLLSKVGVSPLTQSTKVEAAPSGQPNTQLGVVPPVKTSNGWLRTTLPAPQANIEDVSLWGILRNNIGKDLSRISMPVALNEPLSALQRLCEEIEYSELLDEAATLSDPCSRMVKVAAFVVSSYALTYHRASRKPFNPILGETFEYTREDKRFRCIAEQVSHHPPIAACHCESPNFTFWQDARIKNKFWGKSMEVFPIGTVNLTIPRHNDHYQWQKVTSCIHNVFGGQRWVDQYGEVLITNGNKCSCKLTFEKASYWNSKAYAVKGWVCDGDGTVVRQLAGTWNEAMFCGDGEECIWRSATMPPNHDQFYGFSCFAMDLNSLPEPLAQKLPTTDSRLRPDQRLLEEGKVSEAEEEKLRVEQLQREARTERERTGEEWIPRFFRKETDGDQEHWVFKGNYWSERENHFPGQTLQLW